MTDSERIETTETETKAVERDPSEIPTDPPSEAERVVESQESTKVIETGGDED